MSTFGSIEYAVVTGTVAGIAAFNTAVEVKTNLGFAPVAAPFSDGTNITQVFMKGGGAASFIAEYAINLATVGAPGAGAFRVAGDVASQFNAGFRFTVVGSTGNNGVYTVKNGGSSFSAGNTTIPVKENVPSGVADGSVIQYA
jgi:hypothetical protein